MITTTPMVNKSQALIERSIALSEINKRHAEIIKAARTSLDNAIRIGELLSETKSGLKHGEWLPWLQSNLTFSDRTARNYMRCYDERERLKAETISNLTEAYGLLAEHNDSPPKPPGTDADRPTLTQAEKAR